MNPHTRKNTISSKESSCSKRGPDILCLNFPGHGCPRRRTNSIRNPYYPKFQFIYLSKNARKFH